MGNWRNRPRIRRDNYQERSQSSPPRYHYPEPSNSGFSQDGVPSWEKQFCTLIGSIPWQKVVHSKKFMHCHSNILNWDDFAGKEAFLNAKKRFWAEINSQHCDISPPDPNIYLDEVDWNPHIDPELVKDLDRTYFAPDEVNIRSQHNITVNKGENPWECNNVQVSGALKDKTPGWNQWDNRINDSNKDNNDNPWKRSYNQGNGSAEVNAWEECVDKSRGWNQEGNHMKNNRGVKNNGWGDSRNKLWGRNQGGNHITQSQNWETGESPWGRPWDNSFGGIHWESREMNSGDNTWERGFTQDVKGPEDRKWRDCGSNLRVWKQWDNYSNEPKKFEATNNGGQGTWNGCARKRDGSYQHPSGYKSSRFQEDAYQTGHCWSQGRTKKRVSFAFGGS